MTKTEKTELRVHVAVVERALGDALRIAKAKPRDGKDLELLKLLEGAAQHVEAVRHVGVLVAVLALFLSGCAGSPLPPRAAALSPCGFPERLYDFDGHPIFLDPGFDGCRVSR